MLIAGIDSGKKGAIGWINDTGNFVFLCDIPNGIAFNSLPRYADVAFVFVEKVTPFLGAKTNKGRRELTGSPESIMTMGRQYERAMIAAQVIQKYSQIDCIIKEINPRNKNKKTGLPGWKPFLGLKADKDQAHWMACNLFPAAKTLLYGPRGGKLYDRAEALLIAEAGRLLTNQKGAMP